MLQEVDSIEKPDINPALEEVFSRRQSSPKMNNNCIRCKLVSIHIDVDNGSKINIIIKQTVIMGIVKKYHSDHLYAKFWDANA